MQIQNLIKARENFDLLAQKYDDESFQTKISNALKTNNYGKPKEIEADFDKLKKRSDSLNLGFIGAVKVGKSSLINALFFGAADILPKAATPMTAALTKISHSALCDKKLDSEQCLIRVQFFTDTDISKLQEESQKYDQRLNKLEMQTIELLKNSKKYSNKTLDSQTMNEIKQQAHKDAVKELQKDLVLSAAKSQYADIQTHKDCMPKSQTQDVIADNINDMAQKLNDYVGSSGKYTPFTSSVEIFLPLDELKDDNGKYISIVDTPGFSDPVPSRNERARLSIKECDVVLMLSLASHFSDNTELDTMKRTIETGGIKELYVVISQIDGELYGSERVLDSENSGDLFKSVQQVVNKNTQALKDYLAHRNKDGVFDELINNTNERVLFASGLAHAMAQDFDNKSSLDKKTDDKAVAWSNLVEHYPKHFEPQNAVQNLLGLGNIESIRHRIQDARSRSQSIMQERLDGFSIALLNALENTKTEILEDLNSRIHKLQTEKIKVINDEMQKLKNKKQKLKNVLDSEILALIDKLEKDNRKTYEDAIKKAVQDAKDEFENCVTTKRKKDTYTESVLLFFQKKVVEYYDVKVVDMDSLKEVIDEALKGYNRKVANFESKINSLEAQVKDVARKILQELLNDDYDKMQRILKGMKKATNKLELEKNIQWDYWGNEYIECENYNSYGSSYDDLDDLDDDSYDYLSKPTYDDSKFIHFTHSDWSSGTKDMGFLDSAKSYMNNIEKTLLERIDDAFNIAREQFGKFVKNVLKDYQKDLERLQNDLKNSQDKIEMLNKMLKDTQGIEADGKELEMQNSIKNEQKENNETNTSDNSESNTSDTFDFEKELHKNLKGQNAEIVSKIIGGLDGLFGNLNGKK